MEINSLYFDNLTIDSDFRWLLTQRFEDDDLAEMFGEINLVPIDYDLNSKVDLPAVTISVVQSDYDYKDDLNIQNYANFYVELNVYTSGKNKIYNNMYLCNEIIRVLQSNGQLPNYYCRGLKIEENTEMNTMLDDTYRRIIRMSGLCDNSQKIII